jgi:8-oxo-dGTP diphosphatase
MPERFTLSELQEVYEIILRQEMDKRNFRKWVLALEQIEETDEERRGGIHRPARLYRVKHPGKVEIIK